MMIKSENQIFNKKINPKSKSENIIMVFQKLNLFNSQIWSKSNKIRISLR